MTVQICTTPESGAERADPIDELMPDIEHIYLQSIPEYHMAVIRKTLGQETSKAGRTWNESMPRQRYRVLQVAGVEEEAIRRVFMLIWDDLPSVYKRAYEDALTRFVEWCVKMGWAR